MWFILHGLGVITFPYDGKSIVGEWKEGKEWNTKHTKKDGTFIGKFENGEWIEGETLYGWGKYPEIVWKGFGDKETHPKYKGEVENGVPNGLGIFNTPLGNNYEGVWKGSVGKMWSGTGYDKNGNIFGRVETGKMIRGKYVNGKWMKP